MKVADLVRESLREQADQEGPVPGDFAGRVLAVRRRRRARTMAGASLAVVTATVVAVAAPGLGRDSVDDGPRPASELRSGDVLAHPGQTPPRELIAAGDTALAAYSTNKRVKQPDGDAVVTRTYRLLDQKTGTYREAPRWSWLDVAPGMRTAAVLERGLPAKRIGLLNLMTGKVERWIPVDHGVGGVEFSPDGRKLVATTYAKDPDRLDKDRPMSDGKHEEPGPADPSRTGFYVLDVASGEGSWSKVKTRTGGIGIADINARQDFAFSHDGSLVYTGLTSAPHQQYYDFEGRERSTPAKEKHLRWFVDGGLSPNGKLAAGDFAGGAKTTASEIIDPLTGKRVAKIPGQQLLAWADNKRLIAWDIAPGTSEYRNRLVLVTIGSEKTVPLSGYRSSKADSAGRWQPVFAER
ncbi:MULTISPECIES: WD40 repeat domain-containing protein [Streptomyces]|uniref:WD40 repeat domain-containing protein n=1 Tax=Streptomyces TaxID=1883 RepID=UPI001E47B626|nr:MULTISPECIES: WD40 repeat domain-containing protein [Streptomyces]UFQ14940.1 WD40 repeat domain-containing protein [Streptomyces huasconensis]WCL84546.1 WD40 repeat domain-containing protein [Streptomyces sp. JCM 35825]